MILSPWWIQENNNIDKKFAKKTIKFIFKRLETRISVI